jgi:glycine betaine/proline transport system permease protein
MSVVVGQRQVQAARLHPAAVAWGAALVLLVATVYGRSTIEPLIAWAYAYPRGWIVPLRFWISDFMKWLIQDLDFGLFTFREMMRAISWGLEWPLVAARNLLVDGFVAGHGQQAVQLWPALPWIAVIAALTAAAYYARGRALALLVGICFTYLAVFGQWESAMTTLSSIVISVALGVIAGLLLGIAGFRWRRFETAMTPVLDLMQTVPIFAYLIPALYLFGFSPVAAMIATVIYAMPPMVRITMLALRQVPADIIDFGQMAGCTRLQLLWKVRVRSARPALMVGVNQVIMLSLNMVIIASMIGAGGLGFDVLTALKTLKFGAGLEAGIAIVVLAIALDRLSQALAARTPTAMRGAGERSWQRHPYLVFGTAAIAATWILGYLIPPVATYPAGATITTGPYLDSAISAVNVCCYDYFEAVKTFVLLNLMIPFKRFLLSLPWPAVIALIALAGYQLGGWRLAALVTALAGFIVVTGQWENAMITVYLVGVSVIVACAIGFPIGVWAARNARVNRVVQVVIDTLQTLPSLVYLIPAVMLLSVGEFTATVAVVAYAVAPAIRYTIHGIRQVPAMLTEAAVAQGCTRRQVLWRVQIPLALPEILLGINQTIMLALSMVVITALVGTRDLGQEVYVALTKADTGRGLVAGVCVAFIAIIADRLIGAASRRVKQRFNLA